MQFNDFEKIVGTRVKLIKTRGDAVVEKLLNGKRFSREEEVGLTVRMQKQYEAFQRAIQQGLTDDRTQNVLKLSPQQAERIRKMVGNSTTMDPKFLTDRVDVVFQQGENKIGVGVYDYDKEEIKGFDLYINNPESVADDDIGLLSLTCIALPESARTNEEVLEYLLRVLCRSGTKCMINS